MVWNCQKLSRWLFLGTASIVRCTLGIFASQRMIFNGLQCLIKYSHAVASVQLHLSEQEWTEVSVTTIRIAQKTVVPPQSQTGVSASSSAYGSCQHESTSLGPDFLMLHVKPCIIGPAKRKVFSIFMSNFSTTPQCLPKHMVLATDVAPPPFIAGIGVVENNPATLSNGAVSVTAEVHSNLKENQAGQLKRDEKVQSSQPVSSNTD